MYLLRIVLSVQYKKFQEKIMHREEFVQVIRLLNNHFKMISDSNRISNRIKTRKRMRAGVYINVVCTETF